MVNLAWAALQSRRQGGAQGTECPPPCKRAAVTPKVAAQGGAPQRSGQHSKQSSTPLAAAGLADLGVVLLKHEGGSFEASGSCIGVLTLVLCRRCSASRRHGTVRGQSS